jgi:hypothetical protein
MTRPTHIITHEGREYDLTALETPPFLLPDAVYKALAEWPHGRVLLASGGWVNETEIDRKCCLVVRAKPAPVEERVILRREWNCDDVGAYREYGTCIQRADGSIDWSTWEPEA